MDRGGLVCNRRSRNCCLGLLESFQNLITKEFAHETRYSQSGATTLRWNRLTKRKSDSEYRARPLKEVAIFHCERVAAETRDPSRQSDRISCRLLPESAGINENTVHPRHCSRTVVGHIQFDDDISP